VPVNFYQQFIIPLDHKTFNGKHLKHFIAMAFINPYFSRIDNLFNGLNMSVLDIPGQIQKSYSTNELENVEKYHQACPAYWALLAFACAS
jgi:hypothetical protein